MSEIVFGGVSPRSLGDLLKGYGITAVVGEDCPEALFWWDNAFHLTVERPRDRDLDRDATRKQLEALLRQRVTEWAKSMAAAFKPTRQKSCDKPLPCADHPNVKAKAKKKTCPEIVVPRKDSTLKLPGDHDGFASEPAVWARAIALAVAGRDETEPHPLFPAHGQERSGDYFLQLEKAVGAAEKAGNDLAWSLFSEGSPALTRELESGYVFFPEPMKRYATGIEKWVRDDAAVSPWCFLLAVRGALVLRGSIRRMRWGRRSYPAFPFVFEGATVELGKGKYFRNVEVHLPTWAAKRPRTFGELQIQVRQFQARLGAGGFAATAAEFRAAVVGRGAGAAFDTFHRFVLEGRRPGQRQPMRQGVPRGLTRVGGSTAESRDLRLMLAPIAEAGWLDQFIGLARRDQDREDRLRAARARVERAVDLAIDEPGLDTYRGVLEALWSLNRDLVLPGALRRDFEDARRTPRPLPRLPHRLWERALDEGLRASPAYRLGRALGSVLGLKSDKGAIGPILEHMLPVQYDSGRWVIPDRQRSRSARWAGLDPLGDFREMFWSRWLDSAPIGRLPFSSARNAPLADVVALLRGEVDAREIHRLAGLFALLDWRGGGVVDHGGPSSGETVPVPPGYAALRLWLELGIRPPPEARPPRDGQVARHLSLGSPVQAARASELALSRLRTDGLPWNTDPRPTGKGVARFRTMLSPDEAARLALAISVPISREDTIALSRRLWVPVDEQETAA